ncbi:MAG: S9 family peptidase [Thermomicrobiales bacterium]
MARTYGTAELTAELITGLRYATSVAIRPDGAQVAYEVGALGRREEHPLSAIWLTGPERAPRQLTAGEAEDTAPRWSRDGAALYFLSDRAKRGTAQLYRIDPAGGEAERLTDWEPGVAGYTPLPDGRVALLAIDPDTEEDTARKERRDDAEVYGEHWPLQRLRLLDPATREITTVEGIGERHVVEVAPARDGRRLALIVWPTSELDNMTERGEILLLDLDEAGVAPRAVAALTAGGGDLRWGPGDASLFYNAHLLPGMQGGQGIFQLDLGTGTTRTLAHELDSCPSELRTDATGEPVVLLLDHLTSWLTRLDLPSGQPLLLTDFPGEIDDFSVSDDGHTIAFTGSTRNALGEVWMTRAGSAPKRVTTLNPELADIAFGAQEPIQWTAPDGLEIEGLLILPPGATRADGPFPLMTLVHGGPYWRYADTLQLMPLRWGQWLATAGYAVLLPNPRGGSGRGHAFANTVAGAVGMEDWRDILAGVDYVVEEGIADPERLGIGGWSQGGFMTAWAVGQTRRFKLGIMGAGVSDWGMMTATSDLPHFELMLGGSAPWDGPGPHRHAALSPISFADRVTTPLLILHGAEDARVPVSQGTFMAQALRARDIPCELVTYPREPHGIRERPHQLDLLRRVRAWTERWLGPGWENPRPNPAVWPPSPARVLREKGWG